MYFDYYYLVLVVPALLVALWAQIKVKTTFSKYSRVPAPMTGAQASEAIQRRRGLSVPIQPIAGELTDNYDPRNGVIHLSQPVCNVASVAAVGVAAHETGHALQYAEGYAPMKLRGAIVPATQIASSVSMWLFIIGLFIGAWANVYTLAYIGLFGFFLMFLFQLITLPVEFNASRRALRALEEDGVLTAEELRGARQVLTAAALTYVAAMLVALTQFLRLLLILSNNRNRRS